MRFLLDMGLARSTAQYLRDCGHDALHLREQGLQRLPDAEIVAKAVAEHRIVLTHDLDFGRIVELSRARVPSVVTFRLGDMRAGEVNRQLYEQLGFSLRRTVSIQGARFAGLERGARGGELREPVHPQALHLRASAPGRYRVPVLLHLDQRVVSATHPVSSEAPVVPVPAFVPALSSLNKEAQPSNEA